jgi:hypothetical protein
MAKSIKNGISESGDFIKRTGKDHIQVLQTLFFSGLITRQTMKSIRGQVLAMRSDAEREAYLKKIIARNGGAANADREKTKADPDQRPRAAPVESGH